MTITAQSTGASSWRPGHVREACGSHAGPTPSARTGPADRRGGGPRRNDLWIRSDAVVGPEARPGLGLHGRDGEILLGDDVGVTSAIPPLNCSWACRKR